MVPTRSSARLLVTVGVVGLAVVILAGGAVLSVTEGTTYIAGLHLAFSTVSTTGFGMGPQTTAGTLATVGVFAAGAVCWFAILMACFELGLRRYYLRTGTSWPERFGGGRWQGSVVPKGRG